MTWSSQTAGDACAAQAARAEVRTAHPQYVLVMSILASSLAFVDGSVVNVGLPAIGQSFNADAADLQWAINAYLLPLSALLLVGGAAGDRYGHRITLVLGVGLFAASSVLCAAAPSMVWLLIARALQGVGAAILLPNSLAILGSAFSGAARGRAIGTWSAASAMASAIGPVLGGWLIDVAGWREIFLLNLPLAAAAIGLAIAFVNDSPSTKAKSRLDLLGAALAVSSLLFLTWGLTVGAGRSGWSLFSQAAAVLGVGLLAAFVITEHYKSEAAMVPLAPFESGAFVGLSLLTFLLYGALGATFVLVPYVLIQGAGYSATTSGAALLPFPLVLALGSPILGRAAGRIGSRIPIALGALVVAAGLLLLSRVGATGDVLLSVLAPIVIISVGMAGVAAPLTTAVLASVDARHTGSAAGMNSAFARLGGLIATALLGRVLSERGPELFVAFHVAAVASTAAALAAGAAAFVFLERRAGPH
jgi:EmrB/QacA subfamily drug resistance transporter